MLHLFRQALDNSMPGSPAYLEALEQMFIQDRGSGLIEVETAPDCQVLILFLEGSLIGRFFISSAPSKSISASEMGNLIKKEVPVRSLELSSQALRAVLQAIEWSPPQSLGQIKGKELDGYIESLKLGHSNGLLMLRSEQVDGFLAFAAGVALPDGIILSTRRGFSDTIAVLHNLPTETFELFWYEMRPESETASRLQLKVSIMNWVSGFIWGYELIVGSNLINALDYDINTALRLRRVNIRMVGASMLNQHLFLKREAERDAYLYMFKKLVEHCTRVIGTALARKVCEDSFQKLVTDNQKVLREAGITPDAVGQESKL
jgi:hypothetical protein